MLLVERFPSARPLLAAVACLAALPALQATDYYLGRSAPQQNGVALSDIPALNALSLRPGDRIFFAAGETFTGTVELNSDDAGTPSAPILLTSYGSGRATLHGGTNSAISIYNAAGFIVRELDLTGSGPSTNTASGLVAGVYLPTSAKLPFLRFENLKVSGFKKGVELWGWFSGSTRAYPGFSDVKLTGLEVFDNLSVGIETSGTVRPDGDGTQFSHTDVTVAHCRVWDNRGDPASRQHTGSGILLGGVDRGLVEYSVAHDNGGRGPTTGGGPFGMWCWESRAITFQYNLVYRQHTSSNLDGGAYDLDGGSSNCVVQYNYSYQNDGPAIGLIQFNDASPHANSIVRYNISENDCRKHSQGVLYVGEYSEPYGITNADIYGNTFFVSTNPRGGKPPLVKVENHDDIRGIRVRNNVFIATHNNLLVTGVQAIPSKALYQGNNYWGGTFDLAKFRAGGQETLDGTPVGSRVDPQLANPGHGGAPTEASQLPTIAAYLLRSSSPLVGAGLDLTARFNLHPGATDFYGLPISSATLDVGASAVSTPPAPAPVEPEPLPEPEPQPEPIPSPAPSPAVLVDDDFTGSGSLSGRTPDLAAVDANRWMIHAGTTTIGNGEASTNTSFRGVIETGASDCTIETPIVFSTAATGIILRSTDGSNYLRLLLNKSSLQLMRTAAGKNTTLATVSKSFALGRTYVLRTVLAGSTISVSIDGTPVATFTTTFNQTGTRHGLLAINSGVRKWERFTVTR